MNQKSSNVNVNEADDCLSSLSPEQIAFLNFVHVHFCVYSGGNNKAPCEYPGCSEALAFFQHLNTCQDTEKCQLGCKSMLEFIGHFYLCFNANCSLCKPIRFYYTLLASKAKASANSNSDNLSQTCEKKGEVTVRPEFHPSTINSRLSSSNVERSDIPSNNNQVEGNHWQLNNAVNQYMPTKQKVSPPLSCIQEPNLFKKLLSTPTPPNSGFPQSIVWDQKKNPTEITSVPTSSNALNMRSFNYQDPRLKRNNESHVNDLPFVPTLVSNSDRCDGSMVTPGNNLVSDLPPNFPNKSILGESESCPPILNAYLLELLCGLDSQENQAELYPKAKRKKM